VDVRSPGVVALGAPGRLGDCGGGFCALPMDMDPAITNAVTPAQESVRCII